MFLKEFTSNFERYFNSYGYGTFKSFNSHGIRFIETARDNDELYIVIRSKKIVANLYTSESYRYNSYYEIMKKNILRSIIEESSRGTIIPV